MDTQLTKQEILYYILLSVGGIIGAVIPFFGLLIFGLIYLSHQRYFTNRSKTQILLFNMLFVALALHFVINLYLIYQTLDDVLTSELVLVLI